MRILLTGGHGFVAGSVIRNAGADVAIHAISRQAAATSQPNLTWHTVDPLDADALHDVFHDVEPEAVIHTAAIADIDYCEHHQDVARRVNVDFTEALADLCADHDAKLVFCSTDTVFDGERGDYDEGDAPRPINYYGRTKVDAEARVLAANDANIVARVALVMGLAMVGKGNSFLERWMPALREGREIGVPDNEVRTPIDVVTLGRALLELAGNRMGGIVHMAGNDKVNRYELAQRVAARLGYDPGLFVVNNPENMPGRAPRPRDVSMVNTKARAVLSTPMADLERGIDLVMAARGKDAV